jgi:citrate/tricarballylate utilization protein
MPAPDVMARGAHVMTVCNACRYCEQYCPVFPAMERRLTFGPADLAYLANLCHNCGECLYACQYAPPHEFGINVPRTLAKIRLRSYEEYCWPRGLSVLFERHGVLTSLALVVGFAAVLAAAGAWSASGVSWRATGGDFYAVIPHRVMVTLFGGVSLYVLLALAIGIRRFWSALEPEGNAPAGAWREAVGDALSLRHLHSSGDDCTSGEEQRSRLRRSFHHSTFYGFLFCFASTSVAAVYHIGFGWEAPYGYLSAPVVLGTIGGVGLLVGPAGLWLLRNRRDPELADPAQNVLDVSLLLLLFLTSLTGLLLLALREGPLMAMLLIVHLAVVLALFLTLPYGKFVHGLYRAAALVRAAHERRLDATASPRSSPRSSARVSG